MSLWSEFKSFAFKGNLVDLAVAVVIGAAFGQVIHAMVDDIIMPAISYVTTGVTEAQHAAVRVSATVGLTTRPAETQPATTQSSDATQPTVVVVVTAPAPPPPSPAPLAAAAKPDETKPVQLDFMVGRFKIGHFLGELINFVIIAFAVFILVVKLMGAAMKRMAGSTPAPSEPTIRECPECLSTIPLKAKRCSHCGSPVTPQ